MRGPIIFFCGWRGHGALFMTWHIIYIYIYIYIYILFIYSMSSLNSVHVKYKIFLSAMGYLQFSPVDNSKGSFEEIVERYFCFFFILLYFWDGKKAI